MAPTGQTGKGGQTEAETFWKKKVGGRKTVNGSELLTLSSLLRFS